MTRLHRCLLLASFAAFTPLLQASGPAALVKHPLVGTWAWALFGGSCIETLQYRPNRLLLGTSGQEVVEKTYEVSAQPDARGFYTLIETVVRQNDKRDCSDMLHQGPGGQTTRFIQFSPAGDRLLMCESASLTACFGPLTRTD